MKENLNKMSIKDYFKHLYDVIVENLDKPEEYNSVLTRIPQFCINNNKSLGVYEYNCDNRNGLYS